MWGLSGFGAGLTVVCVWSFFKSIGFNAGSIQLIIAADSISNIIVSIPFLIMMESFKCGDYGVFGPIVIFRNSANYFGAYLFHSLNEQLLELIIGPVLLMLVILKYAPKVCNFFGENSRNQIDQTEKQKLVFNQSSVKNSDKFSQFISDQKNSEELLENGEKIHAKQVDQVETTNKNIVNDVFECVVNHVKIIKKLITCQFYMHKQDEPNITNGTSTTKFIKFELNNNTKLEISYTQSYLRSIPILCISAIFSGVMGAMVGIPGPPIMYAFNFLKLPKNIARANASIANVLNFRAIFYFIFGSLQFQHWRVYMITTFCAVCGLVTGNILSRSLTTQSYHHLLMVLVSLAGSMLVLKGLGIINE
eukprot:TRINITY_DN17534_c0_g1_i1.p1 TRINITY_DN17534_c0_g1~~TRINITY_DN17534_c0_g1_i1.p1  ORF type:complete len:363 (-),score=28.77 TRINITY_DN17534_c0_g1_i1:466-1554(-)